MHARLLHPVKVCVALVVPLAIIFLHATKILFCARVPSLTASITTNVVAPPKPFPVISKKSPIHTCVDWIVANGGNTCSLNFGMWP